MLSKGSYTVGAKDILSDQVIFKKGRFNNYGFEPCANSFFDFYIYDKYTTEPLLKLEDIGFHVFLRKNLNDRNPQWKMPTIRQMMKRVSVSYSKLTNMMQRLEAAHLLTKQSGFRKGEHGENIRNEYVLSDPIQTLEEFLEVASTGLFAFPVRPEYFISLSEERDETCRGNRDTSVAEIATPPVAEIATPPVAEIATYKQTSYKQTSGKQRVDPAFAELRSSMPEKTFDRFLAGARFLGVEEGVAVIGLSDGYAKDWIENRMANRIKQVFKAEAVRCVILTEIAWSPPGGGLVAQTLI
jgi:hypothetical protein